MKQRIGLVLSLFILSVCVFAQESNNSGYLFDKFEKGKVIFKKGNISEGDLNYNTVRQALVFKDDKGEIMDISNPRDVAAVNIKGRIFEYAKGDIFYERVNLDDDAVFYVQWHNLPISKKEVGAYGTSQTTSIDNINQITGQGGNSHIGSTSGAYKINNSYYLKQKGKFKRFFSSNSFADLYKGHEKEVKEYLESESIDLKKMEDVAKAVQYCVKFLNK
ncbi:MAG: hypothetical protein E6767_01675 [Dysgonomonas sp.]|nr:hypothetical protein [Dysgonomonas sp.]